MPASVFAPKPLPVFNTMNNEYSQNFRQRPFEAFSLLDIEQSNFHAFNAVRSATHVAGMMKYVTAQAARRSGWSPESVEAIVLGRKDPQNPLPRLAYLPLPSPTFRGPDRTRFVGNIRRVLVTAFDDTIGDRVAWTRRALVGQDLMDEYTQQPTAMLSPTPASDRVVRCYVNSACEWATVTPVILPGVSDPTYRYRQLAHDINADEQARVLAKIYKRTDALIRKAIRQAGFPDILAQYADIEWRLSGFWAGNALANAYCVPAHLRAYSRHHVCIRWRDERGQAIEIPGPICIGSGRFFGIGLFAALS